MKQAAQARALQVAPSASTQPQEQKPPNKVTKQRIPRCRDVVCCSNCGERLDRDKNAALNIYRIFRQMVTDNDANARPLYLNYNPAEPHKVTEFKKRQRKKKPRQRKKKNRKRQKQSTKKRQKKSARSVHAPDHAELTSPPTQFCSKVRNWMANIKERSMARKKVPRPSPAAMLLESELPSEPHPRRMPSREEASHSFMYMTQFSSIYLLFDLDLQVTKRILRFCVPVSRKERETRIDASNTTTTGKYHAH